MTQQLRLDTQYVDLTDDEKIQRGRALAEALRRLTQIENDHAERKVAMKQERQEMAQQIAGLAEIVRSGREERPIGVTR